MTRNCEKVKVESNMKVTQLRSTIDVSTLLTFRYDFIRTMVLCSRYVMFA